MSGEGGALLAAAESKQGWLAGCGVSASKAQDAADSRSDKYSRPLLTLEPRSGTLKLLDGQIFVLKTTLKISE